MDVSQTVFVFCVSANHFPTRNPAPIIDIGSRFRWQIMSSSWLVVSHLTNTTTVEVVR